MTNTRGIPWGWFVLGLLLSLYIEWEATDFFALSVQTYLFLPVLTGWLASRYGPRVAGLLLALGLLSVFGIKFLLFEYVFIGVGVPLFVYLLAVGSAIAFSQPRFAGPEPSLFGDRWRWLKWAFALALGIALFAGPYRHDEWFLIGANTGFVLMMAVLAAAIDWGALRTWLDRLLTAYGPRWRRVVMLSLAALVLLGFVVSAQVEIEVLEIWFGYSHAALLLFALAFVLPAFGLVDWKVTLVLLMVFFAGGWLAHWFADAIAAATAQPVIPATPAHGSGDVLLEEITIASRRFDYRPDFVDLLKYVSMTLLAGALAPFWRFRDASRMQNRLSAVLLFAVLAVLLGRLTVMPYGLEGYNISILCGVAFGMGLIWQARAVIGAPLIIMAGYLLAVVLKMDGDRAVDDVYALVSIGLVVFPFAYLGFLSNRYAPDVDRAANDIKTTGAGP